MTQIDGMISFQYVHAAPTDILTPMERSQVLLFQDKLWSLPELSQVDVKYDGERAVVANLNEYKAALHDLRPVIMNTGDRIHYSRIHSLCSRALNNRDPGTGLTISVKTDRGADVTGLFGKSLKERKQAVHHIVSQSELDYVYNGVLQHADERHSDRYQRDHYSGEISYVLVRNALLIPSIAQLLDLHARLFSVLNPPNLGSL